MITALLFLLFSIPLYSQSITLRVLGQSTYVESAEASGILVRFGGSDIDKEKEMLQTAMASAGVAGELKKLEGDSPEKNIYRFEVQGNSPELLGELMMVCKKLSVNIEKFYYKLPPHRYSDEDERAIMALKNAKSQAEVIAKNLNHEIVRVLNIDDETTYADPLFDAFDFDSEQGETIKTVMELLTRLDSQFKVYDSSPGRTKGYNLWVTYELRPN
ncbi:MAG: hypothetical protein AB8H12_17450 [Lewinella sp.]